MTENGKGALLGNPHFPMEGSLRFWQSHLTIPGVLNVNGGSLQGFPLVQMGFNENLAWSHTVSNSDHAVLYQLSLAEGDRLTYDVDNTSRSIEKRTFTIEVDVGGDTPVAYAKDFYYSHHGLMLEAPPELVPLGWDDTNAFTLRNAIDENWDSLDHWLAMGMANNLDDFQNAFRDYDGVAFVNTLYTDRQGNAFYINNSKVFNFSESALEQMKNDPQLSGTRDAFEIYILPGDTQEFEPMGINSYAQSPKLLRSDFVQNSNQGYWATNPSEPLSGYSIAYGKDSVPLSLRTRMSLTLLGDSAGSDEKFNMAEIEAALHSNRVYLGELVLSALLSRCGSQGDTPVSLDDGTTVNIANACQSLAGWDGRMVQDSSAAHVFREFSYKFNPNTQLSEPFDLSDPVNTPRTLSTDDSVLRSFAAAVASLEQAGVEHDEILGNLQFYDKSIPGNSDGLLTWAGPGEIEGGFNIYNTVSLNNNDSIFASAQYSPVLDVETGAPLWSGLTNDGYPIRFGATWLFVVGFGDDGPTARGVLTSSQSSDTRSVHFDDQSRHYSTTGELRPILFTEDDINALTLEEVLLCSPR